MPHLSSKARGLPPGVILQQSMLVMIEKVLAQTILTMACGQPLATDSDRWKLHSVLAG
jgi:hypothetical protein